MAELSLSILPSKVRSNGMHKIRVRINHKGDTKYIPTRFEVSSPKHFRNGRITFGDEKERINLKLRNLITSYYDALDEINCNVYTCSQLKDYLLNSWKAASCKTLNERFRIYINDLKEENRTGNAGLYESTLKFFEEKFRNCYLQVFSRSDVIAFERYLFNQGLNQTTVSMHMKRLKAIVNAAIKDGMVEYKIHPFTYYRIPEPLVRNLDLEVEEIKKIRDLRIDKEKTGLISAQDIFMLSYYLGGINMIDLLEIDFSKLNEIKYTRKKTANTKRGERTICFSIPVEAIPILERRIGKKGKLDFGFNYSYDNFRKYMGKCLKIIAEKCGIEKRVCFYSARKSFAQHGFESGIATEILEYLIGQSMKTNRPLYNYIKVMKKQADVAIRIILDNLKEGQ